MPRRLPQPGLMIVGTIVLAILLFGLRSGLSWYQRELARNAVDALGGERATRGAPDWLRWGIGATAATRVSNAMIEIDLGNRPVEDRDLGFLRAAPELETLWLQNTRLTDNGLLHLECLTRLHALRLDGTKISPAGLKHILKLTELREISLPGSALSDANISDFEQLSQLEVLSIRGASDVSLTAIDELQKRLPRLSVYW